MARWERHRSGQNRADLRFAERVNDLLELSLTLLQLGPQLHNTDGFFAAVLERKNA